ncbi:tumor necrosis factor receptor superfamily member 4 [Melanotaenia boesemani]|uniref:tumor necrosis factor receptor superfamily member 4 n=1 Tax=Melanotaenia boesemani TaxID=1250792 RepID=UPI001C04BB50|nr:tumor necrosis factor receptor superfamily member 4 [Melanotaenia boesemani]
MALSSALIIIFTFNELVALDAVECGKGMKVSNGGCEPCSDDYYNDQINRTPSCKPCKHCLSGGFVEERCTKVTDTKCQCYPGYALDRENFCVECADGYFSLGYGVPCKKWTDCKAAGEKVRGTKTSDAICNEQMESNVITIASTTNRSVPITRLTTHRPHEGAQTQMTHSTTSTTPQANDRGRAQPPNQINTGNYFGQALLIFGIAMLVVLTLVTCKLTVHPHLKRGPTSPLNDSCRPPVEESGDSSESFTIKLNPEP